MFFRIAYKTPPLYRAMIRFIDGPDTSTPARPSQCRWRLPPRVVGLLATHGTLWYREMGCPVLGAFGSRSELAACNTLASKQANLGRRRTGGI